MFGVNLLLFLKDCINGIGIRIEIEDFKIATKYWDNFDYDLKGERLYLWNCDNEEDYIAFDKLDQLECIDDDYCCIVQNDNMIVEFEML